MTGDIIEGLRANIRRYRKANGLTLEELGRRINKSKPTVWKYENGGIDVDIRTLSEIAEALNIRLTHLIATAAAECEVANMEVPPDGDTRTTELRRHYMYFYDGRTRKLARSLLCVDLIGTDTQRFHATLFYDTTRFDVPERCRDFYTGTAYVADAYTNFSFQNVHNPVENLFIVAKEPFRKHGVMNGLLTGISYKDFQPISFKVVLSNQRLKEDDKLEEWLKINRENLSTIRKSNFFVLSEDYDDFTQE